MAESRTLLSLHQANVWAEMLQVFILINQLLNYYLYLQEMMILIAIIGAIVACLCSMIIVKILASRLGDQKLFTNFLI